MEIQFFSRFGRGAHPAAAATPHVGPFVTVLRPIFSGYLHKQVTPAGEGFERLDQCRYQRHPQARLKDCFDRVHGKQRIRCLFNLSGKAAAPRGAPAAAKALFVVNRATPQRLPAYSALFMEI